MGPLNNPILRDTVRNDWIDYNGHMNDSAYALVFSMAVDQFMEDLGIDTEFREKHQFSIYTLETHLIYLKEAQEGQDLHVNIQLLDYDLKRMHVFFTMENRQGNRLATSEQLLMGMDMSQGRAAPFPTLVQSRIESFGKLHQGLSKPAEAGRKIGIRKK
ncbi:MULTISPECIES: thioesterase family protein [Fictibacillus]|uniref:Thioesterase family protein n=1 Tax=Fictibacillus terranigra TaxID=3058424 RepID=A0ABT8E7P3_9BACL|nr:thioesterase family protein [Fictibacillus sp. CENA-BCM004]MDN4073894.1 thioesterase family protein [Fictibacillus sp. CENA-BCM004]